MSTTESVESVQSLEVEVVTLDVVLASLKAFAVADLFKVSKASLAEAEKRVKSGKTEPKVEKEKKATPPQLRKPMQWVAYVLKYSLENGWDAFDVENKKSHEIVDMPASVQNEAGEHIYPGGKKMILTHAMSLSKKYWAPKAKEGTREDLYREFEAWFEAQPVEEVAAEAAAPKAPMVRKTAEEKEAEKKEKEAAKEKAKKEAAALKEAAKEAKKAATPAKAVKAPAKAVKAPAAVAAPAAAVAAPKPAGVKPGPKKTAQKAAEPEWTCPTDGNVYPWPYKGEKLLRDFENRVWTMDAEGGLGDWKGIFHPEEDRIDDTVADPYADEEDEE